MAQTETGKGGRVLRYAIVPAVALCLIAVTLIASGIFFVPGAADWAEAKQTVDELSRINEVLVYIDEDLSDAEAKSVGTKLNTIENVHQIRFVSREEALADFRADHQEDEAFDGVQAEDLQHRFVVVLEDNTKMKQTINALMAVSGVVRVSYAGGMLETAQSAQRSAQLTMIISASFGGAVILLIAVAAVVLEVVIIRRSKHIKVRQDVEVSL